MSICIKSAKFAKGLNIILAFSEKKVVFCEDANGLREPRGLNPHCYLFEKALNGQLVHP